MVTYYVIFRQSDRLFIRAGKGVCLTYSINNAKHFTSKWNADNFLKNVPDGETFTIQRIERY